jgi:hypothetical protein
MNMDTPHQEKLQTKSSSASHQLAQDNPVHCLEPLDRESNTGLEADRPIYLHRTMFNDKGEIVGPDYWKK